MRYCLGVFLIMVYVFFWIGLWGKWIFFGLIKRMLLCCFVFSIWVWLNKVIVVFVFFVCKVSVVSFILILVKWLCVI